MTGDANWTVADIVREQARARPSQPALLLDYEVTTYAELDERSSQVANGLRAWGLARQSRIAALDLNHTRYFEIYFGSAKANCTLVGLNSRLAGPEVQWIVNDAAARVLFAGREHYELIEKIEGALDSVEHIVALDGGHPRWPDYAAWRLRQSSVDPCLMASTDDDVIQLYTSGTTGHPKGVCHTNRTWGEFAGACRRAGWADWNETTVTLVCMPVFHVAGFNQTCLTLLHGGRVVMTRRVDPAEILELLARHHVTDTLFVPATILALVSSPQAAAADFSSLRHICYGAAPIAEELLKQARDRFSCGFIHLYGLTEALGASTQLPAAMHDPKLGKLRSVGRPYDALELRIVDAAGRELPPGETGEIVTRCPWIMHGYWQNPEATAAAVRDGWLHSGDAGYMDADGFVYIVDRVKDMIITGGENVYPAEVENALFGHPAIADVAVIGVPDDKWGEAVKAVVVLKSGKELDREDVLRFARARIAGFKLPRSFDVIDQLPRNASGKILRRELRARYWTGQERQVQ